MPSTEPRAPDPVQRLHPIEIYQPSPDTLAITWQGGSESRMSTAFLRAHCPCTTCSSMRFSTTSSYVPLMASNTSTIREINLIGSSALHVIWADGHRTGIYPYAMLRDLAPPKEPAP